MQRNEGCIFTLGEKMQALSGGPDGQSIGAPMGVSPDYDRRQSLLSLAEFWDNGRKAFFVCMQDTAQTRGICMVVESCVKQSNGQPAFGVQYAVQTRATMGPEGESLIKGMAHRYNGLATIKCELDEQELWIEELRRNEKAGRPVAHRLLARSTVASPPPADDGSKKVKENREKGVQRVGTKVCAACSGLGSMTCSRCHSIHYCSKECQRTHWKAVHKAECCKPSVSDDESVCFPRPRTHTETGW